MTEAYANPKGWQWFPFGADLDPDGDFEFIPERYRRRLCLPDRVMEAFHNELAEIHIVLWETDDDGGDWWLELCALGPDGYASKVKVADWIEASVLSSHLNPKSGKVRALKSLHGRIGDLIAKLEAAE